MTVDDLDEGTDSLQGYISLLNGPRPELVPCSTELEELERLKEWIERMVKEGTQLSDIGVLANTRAGVEKVRSALSANGIDVVQLKPNQPDDRNVPGVRVTTMHRAKGLEFFAVGIPFLSDAIFPPAGALRTAVDKADHEDIINQHRSLLHVAATRAKKALFVSWSGKRSTLVSD